MRPHGTDLHIEATRDVPEATMTTISGTFLCKAFEGPYRNIRGWMEEMTTWVKGKGKMMQKLYIFYTTCPRCAKQHGKNYVVLLAQV